MAPYCITQYNAHAVLSHATRCQCCSGFSDRQGGFIKLCSGEFRRTHTLLNCYCYKIHHNIKQTHLMSHDKHMDDTGGSMAPVNQPVTLVTQRWWEVPRTKLLVADVVDAGTDQLWKNVWVDLCPWLERHRNGSVSILLVDCVSVKAVVCNNFLVIFAKIFNMIWQ